jgi:hypothetical protein
MEKPPFEALKDENDDKLGKNMTGELKENHNPGYTPDSELEPGDVFEQSSFYDE